MFARAAHDKFILSHALPLSNETYVPNLYCTRLVKREQTTLSERRILRAGALAAFFAGLMLARQFTLGILIGDEIALLGRSLDPARMTSFFQMDAAALTDLMTADDAFALGYLLAFAALAWFVARRANARALGAIVLVFATLTSITDWTENSLTLAAVNLVAQGQPLTTEILAPLFWLAQMKFLLIYPGVVLLALAVWNLQSGGKILAALFPLFPVIGILAIGNTMFELLRVLWMFVLLATGGVWLWRMSTSPPTPPLQREG